MPFQVAGLKAEAIAYGSYSKVPFMHVKQLTDIFSLRQHPTVCWSN